MFNFSSFNLHTNDSLLLNCISYVDTSYKLFGRAPSVFSVLLLLLRDSSNFKIRIQAASALAVPASAHGINQSLLTKLTVTFFI